MASSAAGRLDDWTTMADRYKQLTIDGQEVEVGKTRLRSLGALQRLVLDRIDEVWVVRAVDIGRLVHQARGACPSHGARYGRWKGTRAAGCCPYAASDGYDLLRQLERRGIVHHRADGGWERASR